jgi:hypothetical protein
MRVGTTVSPTRTSPRQFRVLGRILGHVKVEVEVEVDSEVELHVVVRGLQLSVFQLPWPQLLPLRK